MSASNVLVPGWPPTTLCVLSILADGKLSDADVDEYLGEDPECLSLSLADTVNAFFHTLCKFIQLALAKNLVPCSLFDNCQQLCLLDMARVRWTAAHHDTALPPPRRLNGLVTLGLWSRAFVSQLCDTRMLSS